MTCRYNSGHGRGDELAIALPGTVIVRGDNVAVVSQVCARRCEQTSARGARASERARAHAKGAGFWASALVTRSALRARERRQLGSTWAAPALWNVHPRWGLISTGCMEPTEIACLRAGTASATALRQKLTRIGRQNLYHLEAH